MAAPVIDNKEKEDEFFLETGAYTNANTTAIDNQEKEEEFDDEVDDDGEAAGDNYKCHRLSPTSSFTSSQWPRSYKETTDAYTIAASPNFGSFRDIFSISFTGDINSESQFDVNEKAPLLSDLEKNNDDQYGMLQSQAPSLHKMPLHDKLEGELPIGQGCTFMQTIFNGVNVLAGVGILSTAYTVKEAGWLSLAALVVFGVVCCYTASLMRYCFESREGIYTFPDMGEAAFGKYGRFIVSKFIHKTEIDEVSTKQTKSKKRQTEEDKSGKNG